MSTVNPPQSAVRDPRTWWTLASWAAAVTIVGALIGRYWIPLDDGTLAQSAERVLSGELPHRDFHDPYTGLNALLGALAFRLFGVNLLSLRVPLVVGFALWLPAVWLLARRFGSPGAAFAATGLAATLSVLAYPAAMPTWFALFAVTWGVWCLARFVDGGDRRWLLAAGVTAGVAILFKVVGLYFIAATLLTLAWRRCAVGRVPFTVVAGGCGLFLLALGALVLRSPDLSTAYHFVLPALALCLSLTVVASRQASDAPPQLGALLADGSILLAGALLPVAAFLVPYATSGAVAAWFEGVFLLPGQRFAAASSRPGEAWSLIPAVVAVLLWAGAGRLGDRGQRYSAMGLLALFAAGLAVDDRMDGMVTGVLWYALRGWVPTLTVWGAWLMSRRGAPHDPVASAMLSTAALWGLVQFPYTAPAYFFYVASLGVLATLAVAAASARSAAPVLGVLAAIAAYLGAGYAAGVSMSGTTDLDLDRGGIRVSAHDAELYRDLVAEVERHLGEGMLWAGPDAPEIYYLAGVPNPTPTLYEFLGPEARRPEVTVPPYANPDIRVVVVNTRPLFSEALSAGAMEILALALPESRTFGSYQVRWRAP
jgi:hypothetical protein